MQFFFMLIMLCYFLLTLQYYENLFESLFHFFFVEIFLVNFANIYKFNIPLFIF